MSLPILRVGITVKPWLSYHTNSSDHEVIGSGTDEYKGGPTGIGHL
jgi:hypothetical protein